MLHGKYIVNTRAVHQAAELDALIRAQGGTPLAYPCIDIRPPDDTGELDAALRQLQAGDFDWLVLTSANTVSSIARRWRSLGLAPMNTLAFNTAVVGSATAQAAESELGIQADVMPDEFIAEALAAAILERGGKHLLLPESAIARPTLAQRLMADGLSVHVVMAYETVCGSGGVDLPQYLRRQQVDCIIFTSSSTVDCFIQRLRNAGGASLDALDGVCIGCIGPKTAETAATHGFQNIIVPDEYTLPGLLRAIEMYFRQQSGLNL